MERFGVRMLVLSRRVGQSIKVERADAEIWLTVTRAEIDPQSIRDQSILNMPLGEVLEKGIRLPVKVRLGFVTSSPTDFVILRKELIDRERMEIEQEAEKLLA